jgi:hypothetical protein
MHACPEINLFNLFMVEFQLTLSGTFTVDYIKIFKIKISVWNKKIRIAYLEVINEVLHLITMWCIKI